MMENVAGLTGLPFYADKKRKETKQKTSDADALQMLQTSLIVTVESLVMQFSFFLRTFWSFLFQSDRWL